MFFPLSLYPVGYLAGWLVNWLVGWLIFLERVHYDLFLFFFFSFSYLSFLLHFVSLFCFDMNSTNCHVRMRIIDERTNELDE